MLHRPFQITDAQARLLRSDRNKYELQIACVLMDDPVPARLHWPFLANLRVNGRPLPVMYRQSTSPMGKAGRDPPVAVPPESFSTGNNTLTIQAQDVRPFSVLVRVAKRRTLDEVKAAVPAPLSFPMARAHLERELGGGGGGGSDDSDDDLIVQDNAVLSLRCPISGLICRTPARTKLCTGLAVFDLDNYLELNAKVRKWTCPHCGASGRPSDVIIDGYLTRVLGVLRARESTRGGEDATTTSRVEVEPSVRWRPCLVDNSSKTNDAAWVSAEAMNGVVLGVGGSVLHVPPELLSVSMSGNEIGAGATDLGEESEDEAEELRRAVEEARAHRSAAAEAPATAEEHDVIVISDSEEENEDEDVALASTPAALEPALAPESAQDVETEARERAVGGGRGGCGCGGGGRGGCGCGGGGVLGRVRRRRGRARGGRGERGVSSRVAGLLTVEQPAGVLRDGGGILRRTRFDLSCGGIEIENIRRGDRRDGLRSSRKCCHRDALFERYHHLRRRRRAVGHGVEVVAGRRRV